MYHFDKTKHQLAQRASVVKLITDLDKLGITFVPLDTAGMDNVVFIKADKVVKMSHHSFYRYSGISSITRDKKGSNNESETVDVTDEMYLQTFIKPIVLKLINL